MATLTFKQAHAQLTKLLEDHLITPNPNFHAEQAKLLAECEAAKAKTLSPADQALILINKQAIRDLKQQRIALLATSTPKNFNEIRRQCIDLTRRIEALEAAVLSDMLDMESDSLTVGSRAYRDIGERNPNYSNDY